MGPEDHLENINECPDCASQNIVHGMMRDQIICRDCGLIFEPLAPVQKTTKKPAKASKKAKSKPKKAKKKSKKSGKKKKQR